MGLYTWVEHRCSCGGEVQFQSKSHPTEDWGSIPIDEVPVEVALDIQGQTASCYDCGKTYQIGPKPIDKTVAMFIRET